ncbi:MAG: prepilin-type N-terminal cleavage/methylation domain-containing protein [bacterium]
MKFLNQKGFSLLEVLVATGLFLLFALGIYGGINLIFKIVYTSRLRIIETAILSEKLEVVRNLPFNQVGTASGIPIGVLPYSTTTVRNGITFNIITTVRNIDDSFDGLVTGTIPIDTAPADYKLVEMSIICQGCPQKKPVVLSTRVSPKGLEGASDNGSLFIHVFDEQGHDLQGAVVNVKYDALDITDQTDNEGMLRVIDTPTGTEAYHIIVTKDGYSSDYTVTSSVSNPNPDRPPSNVTSQKVTQVSFQIDQLASLDLNTINQSCSALGSAGFNMQGTKTIGHNPTVYKFNQDLVTDAGGKYNFSSLEWDIYQISSSGTTHDLAGTIPLSPWDITPGLSQIAYLILYPHTSNSLLVKARDSGTGEAIANASVRLYKGIYDQTLVTDIGYQRQTDWSGGSGQVDYTDESKYFTDNNNIENSSPVGDLQLKDVGGYYYDGWLESSTFDMGPSSTYRNINWQPLNQPSGTSVRFQLATSNSSTPSQWDYLGPDGSSSTYYTNTSTVIYSGHNNQKYLRYKTYLDTDIITSTPGLSEIILTYTNGCIPPGQVFFSNVPSGLDYVLELTHGDYDSASTSVDMVGNLERDINMSSK